VVDRLLAACADDALSDFLCSNAFYVGAKARFVELDQDRSGGLDAAEVLPELEELLADLAPGFAVTSKHCQQMVRTFDADGDQLLDFDEFFSLLTCCLLVSEAASNPRAVEALQDGEDALLAVAKDVDNLMDCVRRNLAAAPRLADRVPPGVRALLASPAFQRDVAAKFAALDVDGDGNLDALELRPLLAQLAQIKAWALRQDHCVAFLDMLDKDGNGNVSVEEYALVVRAGYLVANAPKDFYF
jgi:Ca2+-binding EF-hand superfamily protein